MDADADVGVVAAAIGDPARACMLTVLLGDRALPAGELARAARVSPSTASAHLARLAAVGLVRVERRGRHRYHRLADERVAQALEALAAVAPPLPPRSLRNAGRFAAERAARSCYDHLAGALGVAFADALCEAGALDRGSLGLLDRDAFDRLGVALDDAVAASRRPFTRACLDWSERRHHLAGALGAAVLTSLLERDWLRRRPGGRALAVTAAGRDGLAATLRLDVAAVAPGALVPVPTLVVGG